MFTKEFQVPISGQISQQLFVTSKKGVDIPKGFIAIVLPDFSGIAKRQTRSKKEHLNYFSQLLTITEKIFALSAKFIKINKTAALKKDLMLLLTGGVRYIILLFKILPQFLKAAFVSESIVVAKDFVHHCYEGMVLAGHKLFIIYRINGDRYSINSTTSFNAFASKTLLR